MRLIDADRLCVDKSLCAIKYMSEHGDWKMSEMLVVKQMLELTQKIILNAETIDPVKHGHWVKRNSVGSATCSVCGGVIMNFYDKNANMYCHMCGARMDGDKDEID